MINDKLRESLHVIEEDASFIKRIRDVIRDAEKPNMSDEDRRKNINKAIAWVLHVLDFFVTVDMIDMEADLLRLCDEDPQGASHISDSLNDIALSLKQNYQFLCKEGTIYGPKCLPSFKEYYHLALRAFITDQSSGIKKPVPNYVLSYPDIEFIPASDNQIILREKLERLPNVDFSIDSIKQFIDNCFTWSDKINEYLSRMRKDKSIYEIDYQVLKGIHIECNGKVYYETTADRFADAIRNYEKPSFHLKNKDCFYAVLYALYENMGPLSKREQWLNAVLSSFELDRPNYSSTVNRIKSNKTEKLNKFYQKIISILENF